MNPGVELHSPYLRYLAEGSAFFPKINDNAAAAVLSLLDGFLDAENDYNFGLVSTPRQTYDGLLIEMMEPAHETLFPRKTRDFWGK